MDCVGGALYTYSGINVIPTCDWDHPRQLAPDEKANRQAVYVTLGNGEQVPCAGNSYIECGWQLKRRTMSFISLTSHVILLMLVSWMGAELLALGIG